MAYMPTFYQILDLLDTYMMWKYDTLLSTPFALDRSKMTGYNVTANSCRTTLFH